jgi:hypothetical protein
MSQEGKISRRMLSAGIPGSLIMFPFLQTGGVASAGSDTEAGHFSADGVTFEWRFHQRRFHGRMSAPTKGWLAAGFNSNIALKNTYFVMTRIVDGTVETQERIATSTGHEGIDKLGYSRVFELVRGQEEPSRTVVTFVLPLKLPGPRSLDLTKGEQVFLMLAWSHEKDFAHHSAWRRHFQITL